MAIIFDKDYETGVMLNAYNNNILKFHSDSVLPIKKGQVVINDSIVATLYPNSHGVFLFNLKGYASALVNKDNFNGDVVCDPNTNNIVDWTDEIYAEVNLKVIITYTDTSIEIEEKNIELLMSVMNYQDVNKISSSLPKFLVDSEYIRFYKNLPFDVTCLTPNESVSYKITSSFPQIATTISAPHSVINRVF